MGLHAFCYGLAGVSMDWLWKGLARCGGERSSGTTVFPQTQRVRLVFLCVGVTEPLPFLPQGQGKDKPCLRERTNRRTCPGNHPRSTPQKPMFRTSSRARGLIRGWIQTAGEGRLSPKKSPKKPINRMCLGEESTDDPHTVRQQSDISTTGQRQMGASRPRWGFKRHPRQGVDVKST